MKKLLLTLSFFLIFHSPVLAGDSDKGDCEGKISFKTVDLSVESKKNALAAYQIDIRYDKKKIKIVGLEGGVEGFEKPPFYDRAGLDGGHIIIASFVDNDTNAKKGKTRVARLHLQTKGCPPYELKTEPMAAAKPGGKGIPVKVEAAFVDGQSGNSKKDNTKSGGSI
jgi:hypothetical protein